MKLVLSQFIVNLFLTHSLNFDTTFHTRLFKFSSYTKCISRIYTEPEFGVINASTVVLAPNGARPSGGTVLTRMLNMFSFKFHLHSVIMWHLYEMVTSSKIATEI